VKVVKKILSVLKNKYLLTTVGLTVWILFFDKNDLFTQLEFRKEVKVLQEDRNYYANEIKSITSDLRELSSNPKTLEKFAREKYYMKRDNEDIFVLVEKK
jgi:cell division protein FtsB